MTLRPAKLADAIADHIQQLILQGVMEPGERLLSERELSAKLDVSRPSLREALEKLIERGLLVTNEKGWTLVSDAVGKSLRAPLMLLMDDPDARIDCMELRSVMEAAAARYSAERASQIDLDKIQAQFNLMRVGHEKQDIAAIAKADFEFHFAIYEASHNTVMLHFMRSLEAVLRSNVYLNRKNLFEHRRDPDTQLTEHQAILEAILARDPDRAEHAARVHMMSTMKTQRDIQEAEKRYKASILRLSKDDLISRRGRPRAKVGAAVEH